MIIRLIKAIVNALIWLIKLAFKAVCRVINLLHLWLFVVYLAFCGIAQLFWGVFSQEGWFTLFLAGLVVCALVTLYSFFWMKKRKERKKNKVQRKEQQKRAASYGGRKVKHKERETETRDSYPLYYKVKNNEDFLMAEFADRYELYLLKEGKYQYIRTDYKAEENT